MAYINKVSGLKIFLALDFSLCLNKSNKLSWIPQLLYYMNVFCYFNKVFIEKLHIFISDVAKYILHSIELIWFV